MNKFRSSKELEDFRKSILNKKNPNKPTIIVCASTGCLAFGSEKIIETFNEELKERGLEKDIDVKVTGCHGFCERGPLVVIFPQGIFYPKCKPKYVSEIISRTILKNETIEGSISLMATKAHDVPDTSNMI